MEEQLAKFFAGETNPQEREEILKWRSESAQNAQDFMHAKEAWLAIEAPISANEAMLSSILDEKPAPRIVGWPVYLKYAAAIVLLAMITALWYFNSAPDAPELYVFNGSVQTLEDGTVVSLKEDATLEVLSFSSDMRKVRVVGKAFFEVTHDANRPFVVVTNDATVQVLGTSFQVNADSESTEVSVESGLVSMALNDGQGGMVSTKLSKGDLGKTGKGIDGILKRRISDKNYLAWKNGVLQFDRAGAAEVIVALKDAYGVDVSMDAKQLNCRLTAQFNKKTLEEVIQLISATFNWQYQIDKDKVVLSGKGC